MSDPPAAVPAPFTAAHEAQLNTLSAQAATATFKDEPPLPDDADSQTIQGYFSYLKALGSNVPPTHFIRHLQTKIPKSLRTDFFQLIELFHRVNSDFTIDWDLYDRCVAQLLRRLPSPTWREYLLMKKKDVGPYQPQMIMVLTTAISTYRLSYPQRSIPWNDVFLFFDNEFPRASDVVLQQSRFRDLHAFLFQQIPMEESQADAWDRYATELQACSSYTQRDRGQSKSSKPQSNKSAKFDTQKSDHPKTFA